MTHDQLVKVFPDGRTVHIPSDGHPLPGYALALADVERRGGMPSEMSLEAAREHGAITADATAGKPKRSIFARLFGGGKDTDEVNEDPAPKQTRAPVTVASVHAPKAKPVSVEHIVPLPTARPKDVAVASAAPTVPKQTFATASLGSNLFDNRGYWRGAVQPVANLPAVVAGCRCIRDPGGPEADIRDSIARQQPVRQPRILARSRAARRKYAAVVRDSYKTASAEPAATGSTALAYASEAEPPARVSARPMGSHMSSQVAAAPKEAIVMSAQGNTTVVAKPLAAAGAGSSRHKDDLWLRAAMLTPSVSSHMTATRLGPVDMRSLQEMLHKPSMSVAMTFSTDPQHGLVATRFDGPAVVFVATMTFVTQSAAAAFPLHTTASLR